MIFFGLFFIWCGVIWFLRRQIAKFFLFTDRHDDKRINNMIAQLDDKFVFLEKHQVRRFSYGIFLIGVVFSLIFQSYLTFGAVLGFILLFPKIWVGWVSIRRNRKLRRQLLVFIPSLSSFIKSGHGLSKSIEEIAKTADPPISDELELTLKQVKLGTTLEKALLNFSNRFQSENLQMLVHAMVISQRLGTSLSEIVDHLSRKTLEKEKLRQKVLSLTAQGKIQAWIALVMPLLLFGFVGLIAPGYFDSFIETDAGVICLLLCLVSLSIGFVWIYRISYRDYL